MENSGFCKKILFSSDFFYFVSEISPICQNAIEFGSGTAFLFPDSQFQLSLSSRANWIRQVIITNERQLSNYLDLDSRFYTSIARQELAKDLRI